MVCFPIALPIWHTAPEADKLADEYIETDPGFPFISIILHNFTIFHEDADYAVARSG